MDKYINNHKPLKLTIYISLCALSIGLSVFSLNTMNKPGTNFITMINKNDQKVNHPEKVTLTKSTVIKSFTPNMEIGELNSQKNVNKQIDLYLNSITNLNDYHVTTTTSNAGDVYGHDYSATITLNKK